MFPPTPTGVTGALWVWLSSKHSCVSRKKSSHLMDSVLAMACRDCRDEGVNVLGPLGVKQTTETKGLSHLHIRWCLRGGHLNALDLREEMITSLPQLRALALSRRALGDCLLAIYRTCVYYGNQ